MPKVITANMLRTGSVVYLTRTGGWAETLDRAALIEPQDETHFSELARLTVEQNLVTAVYAFDVKSVAGAISPTSVRERIRAAAASAQKG